MMASDNDAGRKAARGTALAWRIALAVMGVVLCVLGVLYYTGIIGTVYGHKSKVDTYTPRVRTKKPGVWSIVQLDEYENPTAYALTEVDGKHLAVLLRKRGFVWSDGVGWTKGSTTVAPVKVDGEAYKRSEVAGLEAGCKGTGGYFAMTTSDYEDAASLYEALVAQTMVAGDLADVGVGKAGVAYGPSMLDYLVYMVTQESNVTMYLFGEDAIEAGAFERVAGGTYDLTPTGWGE